MDKLGDTGADESPNIPPNKSKEEQENEDWVRFKSIRNQLKQSLKRAKLEYFKHLSEQSAKNPRKAW